MEKTNKQEISAPCKVTLNQPCRAVINTGQDYIVKCNLGSILEVIFKNLSPTNPAQVNITIGSQSQVPANLQPSGVLHREYQMADFSSISFSNKATLEETPVEICVKRKPGISPSVRLQYNKNIKLYTEESEGYIISASKGRVANIGPEEYFPQFSTSQPPINLQLSGGSGVIKDGDTVKIKTTEAFVGEYRILGAWSTPALYYYDSLYENQNWTIRKRVNSDPIIHYGDEIYFLNNYYEGQWLCIENNGRWLTTKTNANVYWVIDQ